MLKRIAVLALVVVCLASAKTYTFTVTEPTQAGSVQLTAGVYNVKLEGSQVALTDSDGHRIDVTAKIETTGQKFDRTAVWTLKTDGINRIEMLQLGNTNIRVVFQ